MECEAPGGSGKAVFQGPEHRINLNKKSCFGRRLRDSAAAAGAVLPQPATLARILAGGPRAPRRLADELDTLRLAVGPPVTGDPLALALFNVNTDEDQLRAEELLAGG